MAEHVSKEKNFVSCVVYLHNEGSRVKGFLEEICKVMRMNFEKYEVVCVNDGCVDDTVEQVRAFLSGEECKPVVSLINLSYYQGVESAMNAGSDLAVGDFLFEFDKCDLDFPSDLIMKVYRRALEGFDVVAAAPRYGVPLTSRLFYLVYNRGGRFRGRIRQERFRLEITRKRDRKSVV